jgi:hypothetical protein
MLKKVGIIIGGLIGTFLIISALLPSTYSVQRSIIIQKPVEVVFDHVADFSNFGAWNPWTPQEPSAITQIAGTPKTVGSEWSWKGEETGAGKLTIAAIEPNKAIKEKLVFTAPFESEADNNWAFEPAEGGTKVTWMMEGKVGYSERIMGLMYDGMIGKDFEKGLNNLKERLEKM